MTWRYQVLLTFQKNPWLCISREGDRQQQVLHGPSPTAAGLPHGDRNKLLMPPPHPGLWVSSIVSQYS
ncbi:hypothetical protein E2986_01492 [Frieseomelitta varia]|uniref:Uncharacterized protein n=1 Tax=Frieseomelitta varia TaxID=561572 RepID=A0A833WF06_9HYME|nr:hypothetical protein E2986_01492 [Frieseomelitta varia]